MKGWLRKNRLGIAAVAVLLPATLGITFGQQWTAYFENWASVAHEVAGEDTADYAGTRWNLESTRRISASSAEGGLIGLPAGSDLLVARMRVEPDALDTGKSPFCTVRLQELRADDVAREWGDAALDPIDYESGDDAGSGCSADLIEPYSFEATFIVPHDAGDAGTELALSLSVVTELPDFLRFRLPG